MLEAGWVEEWLATLLPRVETRPRGEREELTCMEPRVLLHAVSCSWSPAHMPPPLTLPQASQDNAEEMEGGGIRGLFLDQAAKDEERRGKVNNRVLCMISYRKTTKCLEGILAKVIWKVGLKQTKAIPFHRLKEISRSESKLPVTEAGRISKTRSRAIS